MKNNTISTESTLMLEGLRRSALFTTYQKAFIDATGLGMILLTCQEIEKHPCRPNDSRNRFCSMLNSSNHLCDSCQSNHWEEKVKGNRYSHWEATCFSGMKITAIPIVVGENKIGYLRAAPILDKAPKVKKISNLVTELSLDDEAQKNIEAAYTQIEAVDGDKYTSMLTLLSMFAIQLSDMANRIALEQQQAEPKVIIIAKRFIGEHLDEKLTLDRVSQVAGVSSFYFCKLFKQTTGLSFTEYINRRRVEWAKRKLLTPDTRVTEVAFDVGYMSLSQFNRSFLKYAGESPTRYRERIRRSDLAAAAAA
ncbi:MAG: helix-turn-helix domain-containing protein [Verrucomicrobiales bacterium]|nr:helix-turn-helix domain-containing protein [Verrucomicrobiales bacterium]